MRKKCAIRKLFNSIKYVDQRFAVKISGISCLALIFNLSNPGQFCKQKIGSSQLKGCEND